MDRYRAMHGTEKTELAHATTKRRRAATMKRKKLTLSSMRFAIVCLTAYWLFPSLSRAQGPVFEITPVESWIKFHVKSSTTIDGKFDQWGATLTFPSDDVTTGVLEVKIQSASVDTGSGKKNGKLKDFFDVEHYPEITFRSTKIVQTTPTTYEVDGNFTIRGVSKSEKLTLTVSGKETGSGEIKGTMVFNRKNYGMDGSIPFVKIADHVDVALHLKAKRISGPPLVSKE
jgi:polyisoprenoid-binding protein YceI